MRAPKRPFFFLQGNTTLNSCTQTAIQFFTGKYNGNLYVTLDFLIYCQKANDPFGTTLKIRIS